MKSAQLFEHLYLQSVNTVVKMLQVRGYLSDTDVTYRV